MYPHIVDRLALEARTHCPHHIQLRVFNVIAFNWREATREERRSENTRIDAEVVRVFRTHSVDESGVLGARSLAPGSRVRLTVATYEGDRPPRGGPRVKVELLERAHFLEAFLDAELTVPHSQLTVIDGETREPVMRADDPDLIQRVADGRHLPPALRS